MNNNRRKTLKDIQKKLDEALSLLTLTQDEEQGALDNLPESLQDSDKGSDMQDNIDKMSEIVDALSEVIDQIGELL